MNVAKELMGASTGLLVLSALAREASYGYQILRRINDDADGLFTWQEGTLYPVLHKLQKEGLVRAQWQEADTGRRRKYYYITAKGRDALGEGVELWDAFTGIIARMQEANHG